METKTLTPTELAERLGISTRPHSRRHPLRKGPPRVEVRRLIVYRIEPVENSLRANETRPGAKQARARGQGNRIWNLCRLLALARSKLVSGEHCLLCIGFAFVLRLIFSP